MDRPTPGIVTKTIGSAKTRVARKLIAMTPPSRLLEGVRWRLESRRKVFSDIYDSYAWGGNESHSGTGSELRATENIRAELPSLLTRLGVDSLLDAPCGDWNWMREVDLPVSRYHGADIVPDLISENTRRHSGQGRAFQVADLTQDPLPTADAILCRDAVVHLSFSDAGQMLENFRRTGARWLLMNTYPEITSNHDQFTGKNWRRLNLTLPPFGFPDPDQGIVDGGDVDPSVLALWDLQALPALER